MLIAEPANEPTILGNLALWNLAIVLVIVRFLASIVDQNAEDAEGRANKRYHDDSEVHFNPHGSILRR